MVYMMGYMTQKAHSHCDSNGRIITGEQKVIDVRCALDCVPIHPVVDANRVGILNRLFVA